MTTDRRVTALLLLLVLAIAGARLAIADPTGASILSNETAGSPSATAGNRSDAGGTITTLTLNSVQQDTRWKAYVGNVSGRLSLDNAAGSTIYDWELSGAIAGEVYVTRYSTVTFSNLSCANSGNISAESTYMNMTLSQADGLNRTFNYTDHRAITIGTVPPVSISADSCPSTATYVNDTRQNMSATQDYDEVLLQDPSSRVVFATIIDDDSNGYDNSPYDFQLIIPENAANATPTTYYFFTELDG